MRHIIDAIAAQGRGDDTELLHVTKGEMAGLDALARKHFGRPLPRNPRTGIKEASLFRDWFGNDVGMALDVAAPVAVGFIPGVGVPAAMAMGAGLGAANQGLGKGGTTEGALIGGIAGGIGAYGGSGLAEGLSSAGSAATQQTLQSTAANLANPATEVAATAAPTTTTATAAEFAPLGGDVAPVAPVAETAGPIFNTPNPVDAFNPNLETQMGSQMTKAGLNFDQQAARFAELNKTAAGLPQPGTGAQMWQGAKESFSSPSSALDFAKANKGNLTSVGTSGLMAASLPGTTTETGETSTPVNKTLPKSEIYYTPYGERRTRLVAAEGGLMGLADGEYGDYDGADEENNPRRYVGGGIAALQSQPRAGISNVGFAKGRYLQGPGDGMSDSIPASIDGKQEARLATGEFVVPADVVSHLGNGDSNAGAKQLHSMMDRARMSRTGTKKQGKQINPRKVMPA